MRKINSPLVFLGLHIANCLPTRLPAAAFPRSPASRALLLQLIKARAVASAISKGCFQGAPKEKKKKKQRTYLLAFFDFFGLILENIFVVFLGSSCRETAKKTIKKKSMGKDERKKVVFSQLFRPKAFDMGFP
jgi:hypothetical protein